MADRPHKSLLRDRVSYQPRVAASQAEPLDCIGKHIEAKLHPDDVPTCCQFPQPGCDANGCCDADLVEPEGPPVF